MSYREDYLELMVTSSSYKEKSHDFDLLYEETIYQGRELLSKIFLEDKVIQHSFWKMEALSPWRLHCYDAEVISKLDFWCNNDIRSSDLDFGIFRLLIKDNRCILILNSVEFNIDDIESFYNNLTNFALKYEINISYVDRQAELQKEMNVLANLSLIKHQNKIIDIKYKR